LKANTNCLLSNNIGLSTANTMTEDFSGDICESQVLIATERIQQPVIHVFLLSTTEGQALNTRARKSTICVVSNALTRVVLQKIVVGLGFGDLEQLQLRIAALAKLLKINYTKNATLRTIFLGSAGTSGSL
jgi:hypothetical protein